MISLNSTPTSPIKFSYVKDVPNIRASILRSWSYPQAKYGIKPVVGPFRANRNYGDLLSRQNYNCNSVNPIHSRPGLHGLNRGLVQLKCDNSGVPTQKNGKYVVDASVYLRFLKEAAILQNFNDSNYGGNLHNANQSTIRFLRGTH
jgi:hypothetical protein